MTMPPMPSSALRCRCVPGCPRATLRAFASPLPVLPCPLLLPVRRQQRPCALAVRGMCPEPLPAGSVTRRAGHQGAEACSTAMCCYQPGRVCTVCRVTWDAGRAHLPSGGAAGGCACSAHHSRHCSPVPAGAGCRASVPWQAGAGSSTGAQHGAGLQESLWIRQVAPFAAKRATLSMLTSCLDPAGVSVWCHIEHLC
jgi:hypothetical protein